MKTKVFWIVVAIAVGVLIIYGVWRCCKSGKQMENQIINLYIKIFCER